MRRRAGIGLALLLLAIGAGHAQAAPATQAFPGEPYPVRTVNLARFDRSLWPARVVFRTSEAPGTLIVDTRGHHLYLVEPGGTAMRYGIAVGKAGHAWTGRAVVGRKARWPAWYPTDDMRREAPRLPARIAPGPANPLGARALYLYSHGRDTLFRIHGTSEPWSIGTDVSSGCIRMFNQDVIALFDQVPMGTPVIVR